MERNRGKNNQQIKILVVDDEREVNNFITTLLQTEGFQTDPAFSGKEAIEKVKDNDYDLILLDIMMEDINGLEVGRIIKKELEKDVPICIITASSDFSYALKAFDLGIEGYIVKPFDISELLAKVQELLNI